MCTVAFCALTMSGAKRRSGYRKGVEAVLLHGDVEPAPGQRLATLLKPRGSNIMEVRVEPSHAGGACEIALALLPARFHKAIWVKRGDALLLAEPSASAAVAAAAAAAAAVAGELPAAAAAGSGGAGPRFLIHTVIYPDQLRALRASGRWPAALDLAEEAAASAEAVAGAATPHDALSAGKWRAKGDGAKVAGGGGAVLAAALAARARAEREDEDAEESEDDVDGDDDEDEEEEEADDAAAHDGGRRGLPPAYDDYPAAGEDGK